ncbi:hypothetical protein EVAR_37545_1 [Eumeta japonica]|uniref:Uncharacterized protein n=1 Tax=Eumeta variegata TaxID=151549 RepID=A0A4C1XSQ9_EUMVA|nr:hypothetical protein EVAR_37545_1 [Eumeta japonica]
MRGTARADGRLRSADSRTRPPERAPKRSGTRESPRNRRYILRCHAYDTPSSSLHPTRPLRHSRPAHVSASSESLCIDLSTRASAVKAVHVAASASSQVAGWPVGAPRLSGRQNYTRREGEGVRAS